jgi:hypothetical protein
VKSIDTLHSPENALGQISVASPFTDKAGFARRWGGSKRWVDCLLAKGMPHLKIGARRVRICVDEADSWMRTTFGTQRNGGCR